MLTLLIIDFNTYVMIKS